MNSKLLIFGLITISLFQKSQTNSFLSASLATAAASLLGTGLYLGSKDYRQFMKCCKMSEEVSAADDIFLTTSDDSYIGQKEDDFDTKSRQDRRFAGKALNHFVYASVGLGLLTSLLSKDRDNSLLPITIGTVGAVGLSLASLGVISQINEQNKIIIMSTSFLLAGCSIATISYTAGLTLKLLVK